MTRATAMEIIREAANKHGFEFEQTGRMAVIRDGREWRDAWVNFMIGKSTDWSELKDRKVTVKLNFSAAIAQMGGDREIEDLRKAAETITRAADLVEELNSLELNYTVNIDEEE